MVPANELELRNMLHTALAIDGPVAIRYPRGAGEGLPLDEPLQLLELGQARIVEEGNDIAIIGIGRGVGIGAAVRQLLTAKGISTGLIDARFAKPLDSKLICQTARRCQRLVSIEDNCRAGGFGSALLELLEDHGVKAEVLRIGIPDEFVEQGKIEQLLEFLNMDPESIAESIITRWPGLLTSNRTWGLIHFGKN
jgi:1-deoxy-D-xylulose-5-phosphate synthase